MVQRVLRGISGTKRGEITGHWGTLHSEEIKFVFFIQIVVKGL
jgi:hypothetical protein